jgi:CheY-like chemotaxis protein
LQERVLIVEDEQAIRELLAEILRRAGWQVSTACCAADATTVLKTEEFDLVVTDMRMETPEAGFEVIRVAKEQPYEPVRVILTAFPIPGDVWRKAGADGLLLKGMMPQELKAALQRFMQKKTTKAL